MPALIMFVDALGYDYITQRPLLPGFWQAELPLETLLGYSSSIVPALWSGQKPDEMGAWNEFCYEPHRPYFPLQMINRVPIPYLRNFLLRLFFRLPRIEWRPRTEATPGIPLKIGGRQFWLPHLPLGWDRHSMPGVPANVEHLFTRHTMDPWSFPPIPLGEAGLDARLRRAGQSFHYWFVPHDFRAERELAHLRRVRQEAQIFICATATIDDAGHFCGPHPSCFEGQLREIEAFLQGAEQILAEDGPPTLAVFSDHGMTAITRRFDLIQWLKPWRLGQDYLAFLDSTMARFWDRGAVPLERVLRRVEEAGIGHLITQAEKDRYGLNFADNRFGDAIYLLDPGSVISPSFMDAPYVPLARNQAKGVHGYAPDEPSTRAVLLYRGPEPLPSRPTHVTDVAGLLEHLLAVQAP